MVDKISMGKMTLHAACHQQLSELSLEDIMSAKNHEKLQENAGLKEILNNVDNMDFDGDTFTRLKSFLEIFFKK